MEKIRRGGGGVRRGGNDIVGVDSGTNAHGSGKTEVVDVEILLEGAEKLCRVYPIPGAMEKIGEMHRKYLRLVHSIRRLERQVADQAEELKAYEPSGRRGGSGRIGGGGDDDYDDDEYGYGRSRRT